MTGISQSHATHTCTETGKVYDLSHLDAFTITLPKKGKGVTDELTIRVIFSNHVYSERIKRHDDPYDFIDHNQSKRYFDVDRYNVSMTLKQTVTDCYTKNQLVKISKSFGGTDNLIFFQDVSGNSWIIVFCFHPTDTNNLIEMHILSTHQKDDHDRKDRYQHVIATARTCLFSGQRYPT